MEQDWDIKPRSDRCGACHRPFEESEAYFSALVFDEEGYRRADHCQRCWPKSEADQGVHSKWQGVFHNPPPPAEPVLKKETAESLLRKFIEDKDRSRRVEFRVKTTIEKQLMKIIQND